MSDIYGALSLYTFTGPDGRGVAYRGESVVGCMQAAQRDLGLVPKPGTYIFDNWTQVQCKDFIWKGREASASASKDQAHA